MEPVKITVNGKEILTSADKTILEVVNENNLDTIPTLCHDKRLEHYTSCFLCVVEVEGMNRLVPSCSTYVTSGMRVRTNSSKILEARKTSLELLMSNHYADCVGPCKNNCPAGIDVQSYIALISSGKYKEALKLVKENNPLPLSIGRVCVRNCEAACRRKYVDEPVAVNAMKRFVADADCVNMWTPEIKNNKGKRAAIIGGGPAGLSCAYYLTLEGYRVTLFEKQPQLGGMLRYGIPEYRLPKNILDAEIKWIIDLGVEVKTGEQLGLDFSVHELMENGFDAVFIGAGAQKAAKLNLDGEENVSSVLRGIDFLRDIQLNKIPKLNGKVIVVGGGNTALDASRSALRCGGESVKIVYRRSMNEMPASFEEVKAAQNEGVEILFLTNPKSIISYGGVLKAVECLKMNLVNGKPGERPKPVPIHGSEFTIECDFLISAIGQSVDESIFKLDENFLLEKAGLVSINKKTMETSIPGVFAGGDIVAGPFTAIAAVAQGKSAALSIINFIETGKAGNGNEKYFSSKEKLAKLSAKEFNQVKKLAREKMVELSVTDRIHNFKEVERGFSERQVLCESERCMECGCSEYYDCQLRKYCDEYHIEISSYLGEVKKYLVDNRHPFISLDPNKCINCGKCVRTCAEILKVSALGFVYRGFKSVVKPAMEKSLMETNCISCGNCIDVCPTGAISEKYPFKILGTLPKENLETICNFCSVGCKINFKKISDDIFYISNSTEEIKDSHNKGFLCTKGRFGHRYLLGKNRITEYSIKINGVKQIANRGSAIQFVQEKLKLLMKEYGPKAIAVFGSPKLSNEELYLLQKFARAGLRTNNISSFSNLLYGVEQDSLDKMIGFTNSTASMDDLIYANVIVVLNSNLSGENFIMELKIKEAQKRGAKLILLSSSEVRLTKYADLWIDSKKGTNTNLLNGIMKECIDNDCIDKSYISNYTNNFETVKSEIDKTDIQEAINYSRIDSLKFSLLFDQLKNVNSNIIFIYNIDSTNDKSINDLKAVGNFLLLTGRMGKENNGVIILREFNNSTGLMDMGVNPCFLPGYVKQDEEKEIERVSSIWNFNLENIFKPVDLLKKLKRGEIKGILIFGEDPLVIRENAKYFNGVELLVVCDSFSTTTSEEADVVIPSPSYIEKSGTYTRCDGTIQKSKDIINSPIEFGNWETISAIASYFTEGFKYKSIEEIFDEIKTVNRFYKNIDVDKSWQKKYFNNGFKKRKLSFLEYQIDFSTYDPVKSVIHYPENYYITSVKKKLG
ncbi:MAG: FAD-dependent oxidoreductase [Bacteroidetes bacterium]|nr:FAD-dependent oxidoreductase [Bacteroidota bacterium]